MKSIPVALKSQQGTYMVIMSVLLVSLVGIGALSIDLGRLYNLRSEMQNAADAAAMAAAMELRGIPGARSRAESAARFQLQHDSRFAGMTELLGTNISLEFFCAIGSEFDPDIEDIDEFCTNPYVNGRSAAVSDLEARYVRITMTPSADSAAYSVNWLFFPVLNAAASDGGSTRGSLNATATAGRNFYMCNYPQVMICNPFESSGSSFSAVAQPGEQFILKQQGTTWSPGNFAFLEPDGVAGGGAPGVSQYLADENLTGCTAPIFTTSPGSMTNSTASAINTRFDIYQPPAPFNRANAPQNWPASPNVINYPRDQTWRSVDPRFGLGDWHRETYFATYHDIWGYPRPAGWSEMTRWEVYNWELSESKLPSRAPRIAANTDTSYDGIPDPDHLYFGTYPPAPSVPDRRAMHVAVVNCAARGINGRETFPMVPPEGFAKLFLTEHVASGSDTSIYAEYISWTDVDDENYHVDVQLYE